MARPKVGRVSQRHQLTLAPAPLEPTLAACLRGLYRDELRTALRALNRRTALGSAGANGGVKTEFMSSATVSTLAVALNEVLQQRSSNELN